MASSGVPAHWVGQAFGLSIASSFPLPGLQPGRPRDAGRRLAIALGHVPAWSGAERTYEWRDSSGVVVVAIDACPIRGYRFFARDAGAFALEPDGLSGICSPSGAFWQRYLLGQVMPFAAVLQGLETFHASAVTIGGGAVALVGASGIGKSTIALNLHLAGDGFLTDDVLAVELEGGLPFAHPGMATAKVRCVARGLIPDAGLGRLGTPLSEDAAEMRFAVGRSDAPVPLIAFCLLEPAALPAGDQLVQEIPDPEPWPLLASTFNTAVSTPERLNWQLDVCSAIGRTTQVLRVQVPRRPDADFVGTLGAELHERLGALAKAS
jgi:hypothetical protein